MDFEWMMMTFGEQLSDTETKKLRGAEKGDENEKEQLI